MNRINSLCGASSLCNNWVLFMNMYDVTNALELTYFCVSSAHDLVPFRGNSVILQHTVIAGWMYKSTCSLLMVL